MRSHQNRSIIELELLAEKASNDRAKLEEILAELEHRDTARARKLKQRLKDILSGDAKPHPPQLPGHQPAPTKEPGSSRHASKPTPGPPLPPDIPRSPRLPAPVDVGTYQVVDAPGLNTTVLVSGEGDTPPVATCSAARNIPSAVILPALQRDRIVAGNDALLHPQGNGESWPPNSRLLIPAKLPTPAEKEFREVPDRRLLISRAWDMLARMSASRWGEGPGNTAEFSWIRSDGGEGRVSATEAVAREVEAVAHAPLGEADSLNVMLIPDWLGDIAQQGLIQALSQSLGTSTSRVRLLWRPVALALQWLESMASNPPMPARLYVLEASLHGVFICDLGIREFPIGSKRIACPVRRGHSSTAPPGLAMEALMQIARDTVVSPLQPSQMMRELLLGRVAFFGPPDEPGAFDIEGDGTPTGLFFKRGAPPRAARWKALTEQLSAITGSLEKGVPIVVAGPLAEAVSRQLTAMQTRHVLLPPDAAVRGGSIFVERMKAGLPTYLDQLPSLDLFTTRNRLRHWEPLIPAGREVFGQEEFRVTLSRVVKIGRGTRSLNSYLRREGQSSFRFLQTALPEPAQDDILCDLEIRASSAGGLAQLRAIPCSGGDTFGSADGLLLDWESMQDSSPAPDGWPKVPYAHGWPRCGQIYSSRLLFDKLLDRLQEVLGPCLRDSWEVANSELREILNGAARASTPLGNVNPEVHQMAPIGSLRPVGTHNPGFFLDPTVPASQCIAPIPPHRHEPMNRVATTLAEQYFRLRCGEAHAPASLRQHAADTLFAVLTWLGSYMPAEMMPVLRARLREDPSNENLTACGRCAHDPEDAALVVYLLVAERLHYNPIGTGTTHYLRSFIYLAFQHEGILRDCDRKQMRVLVEHAIWVLGSEVAAENFRQTFLMALRTIALALRYRQFVRDGDEFLTENSSVDEEALLVRAAIGSLASALKKLRTTAKRNSKGKFTLATKRKMKLVCRVKQWLEWKALTDTWEVVDDDE